MSLAVRVLIALVAGFGAGLVASTFGAATAGPIADVLQPVGTLWVSAIRMAIIPLVIAALVVGVGGARDTRTVGVLGMRGLVMFLVILAAAGVFSVAIGPVAFSGMHIDAAAAESLRQGAAQADRKSTRLNSSHSQQSRMPSSA